MKYTKILIIFSFLLICRSQQSVAETICLKSRIVNGKVRNVSSTVADNAKCTKGFIKLFSSTQLTTIGTNTVGQQGPQGVQGPPGQQGIQGPKGDTGPSGLLGLVSTSQTSVSNSDDAKTARADCPVGTTLLSGVGGVLDNTGVPFGGPVAISYAAPIIFGNGYYIRAYETSATGASWSVFAVALCMPN